METFKRLNQRYLTKLEVLTILAVFSIWEKAVSFVYTIMDEVVTEIFEACLVTPIWEEAVYRYAPIEICRILNEKLLIPVIISVSLLFGFGHESQIYNILVQGVFGMILSLIYISVERNKFLTIVIVHALWNLYVILMQ